MTELFFQRRPLDQLHHQRNRPAYLLYPEDLRDIRMVQGSEHFGFALEPGEPVRVGRERSRQDFDGNVALEICVSGAIHLTHAAHAEQDNDFIRAEVRAGRQR